MPDVINQNRDCAVRRCHGNSTMILPLSARP
jgi:hypothetical protein